jgi:hypothetical protein
MGCGNCSRHPFELKIDWKVDDRKNYFLNNKKSL